MYLHSTMHHEHYLASSPAQPGDKSQIRFLPPAEDVEAFLRWPFSTCSHISHERMMV